MLNTLSLTDFTAFADVGLAFCRGLNVVVGQNGTGKTQLLKAAYLMNRAWPDLMLKRTVLSKKRAEVYFEERLAGLFQPVKLDNLIRRGSTGPARLAAEVTAFVPEIFIGTKAEVAERLAKFPFGSLPERLDWEVVLEPSREVALEQASARLDAAMIPDSASVNLYVPKSIFIPSKEIVSLYEGLVALLERYEIKLDATYRDLAIAMSGPAMSRPALFAGVLAELEAELGGELRLEDNRLVFVAHDGSRTEGPLMAEGFRKLATLLYLIRHGAISGEGETLFWDEPEANLNPTYIRWAARALVWLARAGVQVIVATHSLFLLREFEVLCHEPDHRTLPQRYFALSLGQDGVVVSQGDAIEDVDPLPLLDEELAQSDRFMQAGD